MSHKSNTLKSLLGQHGTTTLVSVSLFLLVELSHRRAGSVAFQIIVVFLTGGIVWSSLECLGLCVGCYSDTDVLSVIFTRICLSVYVRVCVCVGTHACRLLCILSIIWRNRSG